MWLCRYRSFSSVCVRLQGGLTSILDPAGASGSKGNGRVWGLKFPTGFGEYWPSGELEGDGPRNSCLWQERLDRFIQKQPAETRASIPPARHPRAVPGQRPVLECAQGRRLCRLAPRQLPAQPSDSGSVIWARVRARRAAPNKKGRPCGPPFPYRGCFKTPAKPGNLT